MSTKRSTRASKPVHATAENDFVQDTASKEGSQISFHINSIPISTDDIESPPAKKRRTRLNTTIADIANDNNGELIPLSSKKAVSSTSRRATDIRKASQDGSETSKAIAELKTPTRKSRRSSAASIYNGGLEKSVPSPYSLPSDDDEDKSTMARRSSTRPRPLGSAKHKTQSGVVDDSPGNIMQDHDTTTGRKSRFSTREGSPVRIATPSFRQTKEFNLTEPSTIDKRRSLKNCKDVEASADPAKGKRTRRASSNNVTGKVIHSETNGQNTQHEQTPKLSTIPRRRGRPPKFNAHESRDDCEKTEQPEQDDVFASKGKQKGGRESWEHKHETVVMIGGKELNGDNLEDDEDIDSDQKPSLDTILARHIGKVSDKGVHFLKDHVLGKLTGRKLPSQLYGLENEYRNVYQLIEQTITAGEGNSMLLIGPRGSGKSAMLEIAVQQLLQQHDKDFHIVRLDGFVQTDEKSAVRDIWRQLGSAIDEEEDKVINFADTLTSILAMLSHPSEHSTGEDSNSKNGTTTVSVVFLISEFDLFAAHPRQTLLYNLFDIAQARKAPIAVIGMTTRIDIVETLEKRVKSRFSHRTIGTKIGGSQGSKLEGYWEVVKSNLILDTDVLESTSTSKDFVRNDVKYFRDWNNHIQALFQQDKQFKRLIESSFANTKEIRAILNSFIIPASTLSTLNPFICRNDEIVKNTLAAPSDKLYLLEELPELSLSLLICAARLDPILETDTCNFTMAYDEYRSLVSRVKIASQSTWSMKVWDKDVALAAWEKLAEWHLIIPATIGGGFGGMMAGPLLTGSANGIGRREARMYRVDIGLLEIKIQGKQWGMGSILQNWCTVG